MERESWHPKTWWPSTRAAAILFTAMVLAPSLMAILMLHHPDLSLWISMGVPTALFFTIFFLVTRLYERWHHEWRK